MKADIREILYGSGGFADLVNAYIQGRNKRYPTGVPRQEPGGPHVPHTLKVSFASPLDGAPRVLAKIAIANVGAGELLAEEVERAIVEIYGPAPHGTIEAILHADGSASNPAVRVVRKCHAGDVTESGASVDLLRGLLAKSEAERAQAMALLVQMASHTSALAGTQAQALATLATTRTAASSAAELSNPWALLGGVLFVSMIPTLRKTMNLPDDAPLGDVIAAALATAKTAATAANKQTTDSARVPIAARYLGDDDDGHDADEAPGDVEAPGDAEPDAASSPGVVDTSTSTDDDGIPPGEASRFVALALRLATGNETERSAVAAALADAAIKGGTSPIDLVRLQGALTK